MNKPIIFSIAYIKIAYRVYKIIILLNYKFGFTDKANNFERILKCRYEIELLYSR
jgi:hypothetical protein